MIRSNNNAQDKPSTHTNFMQKSRYLEEIFYSVVWFQKISIPPPEGISCLTAHFSRIFVFVKKNKPPPLRNLVCSASNLTVSQPSGNLISFATHLHPWTLLEFPDPLPHPPSRFSHTRAIKTTQTPATQATPPTPLKFITNYLHGGGMDIFWNHTFNFSLSIIIRGKNFKTYGVCLFSCLIYPKK